MVPDARENNEFLFDGYEEKSGADGGNMVTGFLWGYGDHALFLLGDTLFSSGGAQFNIFVLIDHWLLCIFVSPLSNLSFKKLPISLFNNL